MQESEKAYQDLAETATLALHWVGADGTILWANQAELDMLGYTAEEYIGRNILEFHLDAPVIADILKRLSTGERLREYEARLRAKDGSIRHVIIDSSVLFEDGKFIHTRCFTRDVTQRKLAEQALRESEQRLRVMTEATPVLVWMAGTDKLCNYFNKRWLEFTGRTLEQEIGNGWAENVHPEDFDRCVQTYVSCFDARRPFEMEYRLLHRSGQYRWILDHGVPRYAADGTFEGYVGGCLDIHDQKEASEKVRLAAEALLEAEARMRLAQQVAIIGIFEWNIETNVNRWTPELEALYGLQPGTFAGTQDAWIRMVHPDDRAAALQQVEIAFETGAPVQAEWRVVWPDQSTHWILGRWQVFKNSSGNPIRMTGVNIDITATKSAEKAQRLLVAIVESSDDAIVSKDLNGIVTSWNPAAEKTFGYSAQEMIGRPITTIIPPELQEDEQRILATIARGERIDHFETIRMTKDGERIDVSLTISPVINEAGGIIGAAKIARDITQQRKAEQALRTTERLASVGRLAATVAHEINNPLEALTNLIYLAKYNAVRNDVRKYLAAAEEELERISHLTRQTLGFYRETKGASNVTVGAIIHSLILVFASRIRNKRIEISTEIKQDPEIRAVPGEIRQLIANLLSNSIDAVKPGGRIRVRLSATQKIGNRKSGVRLTVADSGPGIPASVRPKLFEPFFTTKHEVGTGLGLWVCKSIVEQHQGSIRVRSSAAPHNSWTVFSVFLPLNLPDSAILQH